MMGEELARLRDAEIEVLLNVQIEHDFKGSVYRWALERRCRMISDDMFCEYPFDLQTNGQQAFFDDGYLTTNSPR